MQTVLFQGCIMTPFQLIINEINNSGVQEETSGWSIAKFANQTMRRFSFDDLCSSRRVFVRDDLPYVLKVDEEPLNSRWIQNRNEFAFYKKIQTLYPQHLKQVPKIYWISRDYRFMLVEKIPFYCDEYDLPHIQSSTFYRLCLNLGIDDWELSKDCSWRFRKKDDDNSFALVDAGF